MCDIKEGYISFLLYTFFSHELHVTQLALHPLPLIFSSYPADTLFFHFPSEKAGLTRLSYKHSMIGTIRHGMKPYSLDLERQPSRRNGPKRRWKTQRHCSHCNYQEFHKNQQTNNHYIHEKILTCFLYWMSLSSLASDSW